MDKRTTRKNQLREKGFIETTFGDFKKGNFIVSKHTIGNAKEDMWNNIINAVK